MGLQRLYGVGISNIYYEENGNIRLTYYIDGDGMSGAGQVNIKIELDNVPVAMVMLTHQCHLVELI